MARTSSVLTPGEILVLEAITNGTYFVENEVPSGSINSSNTSFTVVTAPSSGTLKLYHNGFRLTVGSRNDFTISSTTITMNFAPESGDTLLCDYRVIP